MHNTPTVKALPGGRDVQNTSGELSAMAPFAELEVMLFRPPAHVIYYA